ncbi:MAG: hypothetical protein Q8M26_06650 [Pseudolabrys sp.]|nr:hypothetical protein [Pseudolabrys sp.]
MRRISSVSVAMIMGVALYFTLFWGHDALRMLTSPTYGLDDVWRSQAIFGIGSLIGLAPTGLIKLAAFVGILKLAVAFICAVHIADRFRTLAAGGKANSELLDGGLILVGLIGLASVVPAVLSHNPELVRGQLIQLAFAALAVALCALERSYARTDAEAAAPAVAIPANATWFSPWR